MQRRTTKTRHSPKSKRQTSRLWWLGAVGLLLLFMVGAAYWQRDELWVWSQQRYFQWKYQQASYAKNAQSQIITSQFYSQTLQQNRTYQIYLPAAFATTQGLTARFPVIYLLHGFPGKYDDWAKDLPLQAMLDKLIAAHQLPASLVVLVDGAGPTIADSQYVKATAVNQDMEAYLEEVVDIVDQRYPTQTDPRWRAMGGVSSGGYGAVNFGLHHPEITHWLFSLSGYFTNKESILPKLLPAVADQVANEPMLYIRSISTTPDQHIYLCIGSSDYTEFQNQNHQFFDLLQGLPIQSDLTSYEGLHLWSQWSKALEGTLIKIGTEWAKQK